MATKKLEPIDFMKMDVHRPLTKEEIDEINPQACVDKSLGEEPHRDGSGVGARDEKHYPHEHPLPANVTILENLTRIDLTAEEILRDAYDAGMEKIVIVGIDKHGYERLFRTSARIADANWLLQRGLHNLHKRYDDTSADEGNNEGA